MASRNYRHRSVVQCKRYFDILNRLCGSRVRRTDRQTEPNALKINCMLRLGISPQSKTADEDVYWKSVPDVLSCLSARPLWISATERAVYTACKSLSVVCWEYRNIHGRFVTSYRPLLFYRVICDCDGGDAVISRLPLRCSYSRALPDVRT